MTVVKDITNQVLVPKPAKKSDLNKSFFIGRVAMDHEPDTIEIEVHKRNSTYAQGKTWLQDNNAGP